MGLTKEQRPWTTIKDGTNESLSRVYPAYLIGPSSGAREPDRQPTREDVDDSWPCHHHRHSGFSGRGLHVSGLRKAAPLH